MTFLCGASKGFMKAFEAPQRSVKTEILLIFCLHPGSGREWLTISFSDCHFYCKTTSCKFCSHHCNALTYIYIHTETRQLICYSNQLTGFYMGVTLVLYELKIVWRPGLRMTPNFTSWETSHESVYKLVFCFVAVVLAFICFNYNYQSIF